MPMAPVTIDSNSVILTQTPSPVPGGEIPTPRRYIRPQIARGFGSIMPTA